jgi:uncharacterized alpha-E superfamily protein
MRPINVFFFVSEAEYPALQAACPRSFPFAYEQFLENLQELERNVGQVIRVNIRISEFLAWCAQTTIDPDNSTTRATYAGLIYSQGLTPPEPR